MNAVDAFTILLAPVLTTAFVADLTSRDKQCREWERKIAQVQEDVERLRISEQRIVESLRLGTKRRRGLGHQLRTYSTTRSLAEKDVGEDSRPLRWLRSLTDEDVPQPLVAVGELEREQGFFSLTDRENEQELRTTEAARRVEKLVALKFVIKVRLHLLIGKSPRYATKDPNYKPDYEVDEDFFAADVNGLVQNLRQIRKGLHKLNASHKKPETTDSYITRHASQGKIDDEIKDHAIAFQQNQVSISQLVTEIGHVILKSPEPPSIRAYVSLLSLFSRAGFDDLATFVIAALDEARIEIPNECLIPVIIHYGKTRDANSFDRFLKSLTSSHNSKKYLIKWSWKIVNDVQIPCPEHDVSRLLQALAYTALKCNQPHLAEGWAVELREAGGRVEDFSFLIWSFLRYYTVHCNWRRGQEWLTTALDWATRLVANHACDLRRVIFAMLELSLACGKREIYSAIIQAAANSNLLPRKSELEGRKTDRSWSLLFECEALRASHDTVLGGQSAVAEDVDTFRNTLRYQATRLGVFGTRDKITLPTPQSTKFAIEQDTQDLYSEEVKFDLSQSDLRELCVQQEDEIHNLRMQLAARRVEQLQASKPPQLDVSQDSGNVTEAQQVNSADVMRRSDALQSIAPAQAEVADVALAPKAKAEHLRQLSVSTDTGNKDSAKQNPPLNVDDLGVTETSSPASCKICLEAPIAYRQSVGSDLSEHTRPVIARSTEPRQARGSFSRWAATTGANLGSSNMGTSIREASAARAFSQTQAERVESRSLKSHASKNGSDLETKGVGHFRKVRPENWIRISKRSVGGLSPPFF